MSRRAGLSTIGRGSFDTVLQLDCCELSMALIASAVIRPPDGWNEGIIFQETVVIGYCDISRASGLILMSLFSSQQQQSVIELSISKKSNLDENFVDMKCAFYSNDIRKQNLYVFHMNQISYVIVNCIMNVEIESIVAFKIYDLIAKSIHVNHVFLLSALFFSNHLLNKDFFFYQINQNENTLRPIFDENTTLHDNFFITLLHLFRMEVDIKLTMIITRGTVFNQMRPKNSQYVANNLYKGVKKVLPDFKVEKLTWWRVERDDTNTPNLNLLYI